MDKEKIKLAVSLFLKAIGEDVNREGLIQTPDRVADMYEEIFSGLAEDPKKYLKTFTDASYNNEIVIINDIPLYSVCEHHLLPFTGTASIAYIPKNNKIMGLSKFARIVNCFAKRPQIQERLTNQIATFLFENIDTHGVAVRIEACHLCMVMRGAKALGSKTKTLALRGNIKTDDKIRREVLSILMR